MFAANILEFAANLLNLASYRVTDYCEEDGGHYFHIAPAEISVCPHCGGACSRRQKRPGKRWIRDLPITGKPVWLKIRRDQYQCDHCGKCSTACGSLIAPFSWVTQRLLAHAAECIKHSDVAQVARQLDLPESSLGRWYYAHLKRQEIDKPAEDHQPIRALGIDELSLKKRHRQFVAVIIDHTNRCVLDVLEYRVKSKVKAYLENLKARGRLDHLEEVSCDMWDGYVNAVREVLGDQGVRVCIDRFHIMKALQDQRTKARRQVQRELSSEDAKVLKGSRWLWVKNEENLTRLERLKLASLKRRFPKLRALHEQRESLRRIFENRGYTPAMGKERLTAWMTQARTLGFKALDAFCGTLERWLDGVSQYFANRTTNGRTEGFNRSLRAILWRACGMTNFNHFRLRVMHGFGPHRSKTTVNTI